ncbi:DUF6691 family protein, partial [Marinobacter alexandrii]|uniref:DUF6691 family protein n=1 Tax=Marinobacter alexandrii TaxID=2570351 RepID=UPI003299C716
FVMGGAVCVTLISFRFILRRSRPVLADKFELPGNKNVDPRLLGGAAIFGIGWGVYGYCPGPAISALVYLDGKTVMFVVAMIIGMGLASRLSRI